MALFVGGQVLRMGRNEIGLHSVTPTGPGEASALRNIDAVQLALHRHGERIRPPRARLPAQTARAGVQAGTAAVRALGLQVHLDPPDGWTRPHADEPQAAAITPARLLEEALRRAPALGRTGRAALGDRLRSLPP